MRPEGKYNALSTRIPSRTLLPFQGRFAFDMFPTTTTTTNSPLPCCPETSGCAKCGVEKTRRVIGGEETAAGVYPWIAALSFNGTKLPLGACSATLVSSNWAVTAAHCMFPRPTSLVLGEHDLSNANDAYDTNRKVYLYPVSNNSVTFCSSGRRF